MKYKHLYVRKHIYKSPAYILAWIGFVVGFGSMLLDALTKMLPEYMATSIYHYWYISIWFNYLQNFTQQNNLLLVIFYALWLFAYKTKIFNSNKFLVFVASYIILVFAIAFFMMAPIFIMRSTTPGKWDNIVNNITLHLITPGVFVTFFVFALGYKGKNKRNKMKLSRTFCFAFIYPLLYFGYLITINFTSLPQDIFNPKFQNATGLVGPPGGYISVYSILTNYNPNCIVPHWGLDPTTGDNTWIFDVSPTYLQGDMLRLLTVPVCFLFYFIELFLVVYINNRFADPYFKKRRKS